VGTFYPKSSQLIHTKRLRGDERGRARPYLPRESEEIGATQSELLRVPPESTGPLQVSGRNHTLYSERVRMDANYVRD
jgi:hypothetical protein